MHPKTSYEMALPEALKEDGGVKKWKRHYPKFECEKDDWIRGRIQTSLRSSGHLDLEDLKSLGVWKNGNERLSSLFKRNTCAEITRRTGEAYETHHIEPIMKLYGFRSGFPMASTFMHFALDDEFPVIDRRALSTLGVPKETGISKRVWTLYCDKCRGWSDYYHVSRRDLDRALWQFNVEKSFWERARFAETPATHGDRGCDGAFDRA